MLWSEREWFGLELPLEAAQRLIGTDSMVAYRRLFRR
jgi:hypothetical protein